MRTDALSLTGFRAAHINEAMGGDPDCFQYQEKTADSYTTNKIKQSALFLASLSFLVFVRTELIFMKCQPKSVEVL